MIKVLIAIFSVSILVLLPVQSFACSVRFNETKDGVGKDLTARDSVVFLGRVIDKKVTHSKVEDKTCLSVIYAAEEVFYGKLPSRIGFTICSKKEAYKLGKDYYEKAGLTVGAKSIVGLTKTSPALVELGITSKFRPMVFDCQPVLFNIDQMTKEEYSNLYEHFIEPLAKLRTTK